MSCFSMLPNTARTVKSWRLQYIVYPIARQEMLLECLCGNMLATILNTDNEMGVFFKLGLRKIAP